MARNRHKKNSTAKPAKRKAPVLTDAKYISRVNVLLKNKKRVDPTNRKAVNAAYRSLIAKQTREDNYSIPVDKETRKNLKKRGFVVGDKGVLIDKPRDAKRKPIKGVKTTITKDGIVKFSVQDRTDYIVGLTKKEKLEYAQNPELITKQILARLKEKFPTVKNSRRPQIRLQWGIFKGNKSFAASHFTKRYFAEPTSEAKRKYGKKKAPPKIDNLTGIHVVIHKPEKRNAKKKTTRRKAAAKK